jgi:dTDP-4-dehydrorhamnose 3,5-epimerase
VKVHETALPGVLLLEPRVFDDPRGTFLEWFHDERFQAHGLPTAIRQANQSRSTQGVLRGLHYQRQHPQGKLVSVIQGEVFDVVADIRVGSPTFGRSVAMHLRGEAPRQLWIPPGFAHGFCVLSPTADVVYLCTHAVYAPDDDRGIRWDDPELAIPWPVASPLLSGKDAHLPTLAAARDALPRWAP